MSLRVARRADRRLREVAREGTLIAAVAEFAERGDAWTDHACLTLKVEAAERSGLRALRRLRSRSAARARPLTDRIERHTMVAERVLDQAAAGLIGLEARDGLDDSILVNRTAAEVPHSTLITGFGPAAALVLVAASILAVVILMPGWLDPLRTAETPVGEGVLSGASGHDGDSPSPASSPSASPAPRIAFDFDAERMGPAIGQGWAAAADGDIAIAPLPTSVDRSARLSATDEGAAAACHTVSLEVHQLAFDLLLDADAPAVAVVELRDGANRPVVTIEASESRTAVSMGEGSDRRAGLDAGRWYRFEAASGDGGLEWQVAPRETPMEVADGVRPAAMVSEICVWAHGPPGAAVHYDNVTLNATDS